MIRVTERQLKSRTTAARVAALCARFKHDIKYLYEAA